jgi:cytochrome c
LDGAVHQPLATAYYVSNEELRFMIRHFVRALQLTFLGIGLLQTVPALAEATTSAANLQGKRLFLRCSSCHALEGNPPARIGPTLQGVVGRKAGSLPGVKYSTAMKASNIVWTDATLDRWLAKPSSVVPGTSMAFAGIADPNARKALIDYLKKPGK